MLVQHSNRKTWHKFMLWAIVVSINVLMVLLVNAKGNANLTLAGTPAQTDKLSYASLGEKIRQHKVDVGNIYSVADQNGRFHNIHADKLLMDCSHCHGSRTFKADYLLVSKYKKLAARHQGRVEKAVCLGCHLPGGMGTPWYGSTTIRALADE